MQNFLNMDASHSRLKETWDAMTLMISHSNEVLKLGNDLPDADKPILAEARFWRAFAYYRLYNVFGPIPLNLGDKDISQGIERATDDQIRTFIETEMNAVEAILPNTYSKEDYGRPTKWAVKSFLSRYYLNKKDWALASRYAKEIIDNNEFSLEANYQDVFGRNQNSEVILAINHIKELDKGNKYVALSLVSSLSEALGITGVSGSNGYGMAVGFYRTFDPADKRIEPYNPITRKGIAIAGVIIKKDGTPLYGTVATPKTVEQELNRVITCKWPVVIDIPRGEDAPLDCPIYRLGETYLTYAEAQSELRNTAEAMTYINKVRSRAGLTDISLGGKTQEQVREIILNERGWELYHEGFRREDLVRHGKLLEKVNEKYKFYHGTDLPWKNDQNRLLLLFPTGAMQLNPKLTQNPSYQK
jgi:hypothetical protein